MLTITWGGQKLDLYPGKAVGWRRERTLIIADAHFGKGAAFRHHGIPVPEGPTGADLERLSALLEASGSKRLIILGDFLHARTGRAQSTMSVLAEWRRRFASLDIVLVRGNHDRHAGDPPGEWRFLCVDEPYVEGPLAFCHAPEACAACPPAYALAGHVHPCAIMHDVDGSSLRAPCFFFSGRYAILPAFGSFTGTHPVRPRGGRRRPDGSPAPSRDRIFAIGRNEVIEVRQRVAACR